MTLPVAYNTIQMIQVNTELGRASNYANSSLGESAVRTLAGVASGTISFNNLHGKSNFTPSLAAGSYIAYRTGGSVTATLAFNTNGSLSKSTTSSVATDT